jgi:hypothetical protein
MGLIQRQLESAALQRERSDLGGTITFPDCPPIPCAIGVDTSGIQRADNSAGYQLNQSRRVVVRTAMLASLPRTPQAGDLVEIKGNLEENPVSLAISPSTGIEQMNAILTAFNLYNPNA